MHLGSLVSIPVATVWPSEPADFTPWLAENIELLSDCLGLDIEVVEIESRTDDYRIDIVGRSGDAMIVIENQLTKSDHRHLGQILTYAAAFHASTAVWIVSEASGDHIKAVGFLNDHPSCDFFLVKIEVLKIGDSMPAPRFSLIAGPGAIRSEVQLIKSNQAREDSEFSSFWNSALELINEDERIRRFFGSIRHRKGSYIDASRGLPRGVSFRLNANRTWLTPNLYIDLPRAPDDTYNHSLYTELLNHKPDIEARFDSALDWGTTDRRYRRVAADPIGFDLSDETTWREAMGESKQQMSKLIQALEPELPGLLATARNFAWDEPED